MTCPHCGRLPHLGVCVHCGVDPDLERQTILPFRALARQACFRRQGSVVLYRKASDFMADVIAEMRHHLEAPDNGFYCPDPEEMIEHVGRRDVEATVSPKAPVPLAGLIAIELSPPNIFFFVDGPQAQQKLLCVLAGALGDDNTIRVLQRRTPDSDVRIVGCQLAQIIDKVVIPFA